MKAQENTLDELRNELEELRQKYNSIMTLYDKAVIEHKIVLDELDAVKKKLYEPGKEFKDGYASLHSIFENPGNVIAFSLDTEYRYLSFSENHRETIKKIWGAEIEVGMNMLHVIKDPNDCEKAKRNFDRVLKGEYLRFQEEYGDPALLRTHYENFYNPIFDNKEIIGIAVLVIDITELKEVESKLRISLTKYQILFDTIPIGVTISDNEGKIIETNKLADNLIGLSKEEQERRTIDGHEWRIIRPDGTPMPSSEYASVRAKKEGRLIDNVEMGLVKENGNVTWISVSAAPIPLEGYGVAIVFKDITKRKRTEDAFEQKNIELKAIYDYSPVMMCLVDLNRRVLFANPAFSAFTGIPEKELKGGSACGVFGCINALDDIRGCGFGTNCQNCTLRLAMENTLQTGASHSNIEHNTILLKNGEARQVSLLGSTALIQNKGQTTLLLCLQDISQRKNAENQLNEMNRTLEQRVAERTIQLETTNKELSFHLNEIEQFTYIASHDLQEPLRTLTTFTGLIHEEYAGKLDEEGNKYIEFISHSANRMRALVTGLLEYSLLGKELLLATVDCQKIVDDVLSDLASSIEISHTTISVGSLPRLTGYETELRLLFQNLVMNAIKFQGKENHPVIRITAENQGQEWQFSVEDNGIGIKEQDKKKVFIIFKRMHNQKEYPGTGIGLAHCKKIVELHGGKIWVESTPGGGSTFFFTIPKRNQPIH